VQALLEWAVAVAVLTVTRAVEQLVGAVLCLVVEAAVRDLQLEPALAEVAFMPVVVVDVERPAVLLLVQAARLLFCSTHKVQT
jgi:hypothetical protein